MQRLDLSGIPAEQHDGLTFHVAHLCDVAELPYWEAVRAEAPVPLDLERACEFERVGRYLLFVVREPYGGLVGSCGVYLAGPAAREDVMWLAPELRKGWTALKFYAYGERVLRGFGIARIQCTIAHDDPRWKLWARAGFGVRSFILEKEVA